MIFRLAGSPRLLLLASVVLAVTGALLLHKPQEYLARRDVVSGTAAPAASASASARLSGPGGPASTPAPTGRTVGARAAARPTSPFTAAASRSVQALPPHGEGPDGDAVIQKTLEQAWPSDLPPADQKQLLAAGRDLLRGDATGTGRSRWPGVFPDSPQGVAPAFAAGRFRIQAAIARQDGGPDAAVVHLVWAGADRGGTYTDNRITDWHFTRTHAQKGLHVWIPKPRT